MSDLEALKPRTTLLGLWDQIVGPGATATENIGTLGFMLVGAIGASPWANQRDQHWNKMQKVVASLAGTDLLGGVWANGTRSTRRWWHRPGQGPGQHLAFTSAHVYPFLVAKLYRQNDWSFAFGNYFYLLLAAVILVFSPRPLQRPLSLALYLIALTLNTYIWKPTPGLEWFAPLLFLKLLVAHLPAPEGDKI